MLGVGRIQRCLQVPEMQSKCRKKREQETPPGSVWPHSDSLSGLCPLDFTGGQCRPVWVNLLAGIFSFMPGVPSAPVSIVAKSCPKW